MLCSKFSLSRRTENEGRSRRSLAGADPDENHPPDIAPVGGVPNLKVGNAPPPPYRSLLGFPSRPYAA
jgi:hypothetical protein